MILTESHELTSACDAASFKACTMNIPGVSTDFRGVYISLACWTTLSRHHCERSDKLDKNWNVKMPLSSPSQWIFDCNADSNGKSSEQLKVCRKSGFMNMFVLTPISPPLAMSLPTNY